MLRGAGLIYVLVFIVALIALINTQMRNTQMREHFAFKEDAETTICDRDGERCATLKMGQKPNIIASTIRLEVPKGVKPAANLDILSAGNWNSGVNIRAPKKPESLYTLNFNNTTDNVHAEQTGMGLIAGQPGKPFPASRSTLATHIHQDYDATLYSSGWNPLWSVKGGTGDAKLKGQLETPVVQTDRIRLGNKFSLSGVGERHGNDQWLRVMNKDGTDYGGGLAASKLATPTFMSEGGGNTLHGATAMTGTATISGAATMNNDATVAGKVKASRVQLGNKFLLSGVGDGHANDDWLRMMNKDGTDYYGGFATGRLWTPSVYSHGSGVVFPTNDNSFRGGASRHNPGWGTHLPWPGDNKNYIRGDTELRGDTNNIGDMAVGGKLCLSGQCLTSQEVGQLKTSIFFRGMIIMWSGAINTIPRGWALCDGANGTPDLRNRFVVGAGYSWQPGAQGGAWSYRLGAHHLPPHAHSGGTSTDGNHGHSASSGSAGNHSHSHIYAYTGNRNNMWHMNYEHSVASGADNRTWGRGSISTEGAHTHTIAVNANGNHSHSFTTNNGPGSSSPYDVAPPFYALAYIMKL